MCDNYILYRGGGGGGGMPDTGKYYESVTSIVTSAEGTSDNSL